MRVVAVVALVLGLASPAHAAGFFQSLSKSATRTLKKTNRLVLTVKLVFKPRKGKTVTRTVKVTLRKLPKLKQTSPHKPDARIRLP